MNLLHTPADPALLTRPKQMLDRADNAAGYLFVSRSNAVTDELSRLDKVRMLGHRPDALQ